VLFCGKYLPRPAQLWHAQPYKTGIDQRDHCPRCDRERLAETRRRLARQQGAHRQQPENARVKMLITRPRNSSGTWPCNKALEEFTNTRKPQPVTAIASKESGNQRIP